MRRPLRIELCRGTAPAAGIAMLVAGIWTLAVHTDAWVGRWIGLATYVRVTLLVLCGPMIAAGAWQAGRERRQHMAELLGSVPRPAWQPVFAAWLAVSFGGVAGYLVALAGAAAVVGPVATYSGGQWAWILVVGIETLWMSSALGYLLGRVIPLRVIAPVAGLASYLLIAVSGPRDSGFGWLNPSATTFSAGRLVPDWVSPLQATILLLVTVGLVAWAGRQHGVAVLSGVLAAAVAVPLALGPGTRELRVDPAATELVCTTDGRICLATVDAFLLDEVAAVAGPIMSRLEGIPGAPRRAVDSLGHEAMRDRDRDIIWLDLYGQASPAGGLAKPEWLRADFRQILYCDGAWSHLELQAVANLAWSWMLDEPAYADVPLDRLKALPMDAQRAWFGDYLAAVRACDVNRMREMGERL